MMSCCVSRIPFFLALPLFYQFCLLLVPGLNLVDCTLFRELSYHPSLNLQRLLVRNSRLLGLAEN